MGSWLQNELKLKSGGKAALCFGCRRQSQFHTDNIFFLQARDSLMADDLTTKTKMKAKPELKQIKKRAQLKVNDSRKLPTALAAYEGQSARLFFFSPDGNYELLEAC